MRGRTFFLLGLTAGLSALPLCPRPHRAAHSCSSLVPVVVAARDLPEGTVVTLDDLSQRSMPEHFVTPSMVKPDSAPAVVGQRLLNPQLAGDPLRWVDVARPREALEPDTRLVTIEVEPARALGGQLRAHDHVDVLTALTDPPTGERGVQTLIQNAVVLEVIARPEPALTRVRLRVTPDEAQQLLLAQEVGRFSLSLRNPDDLETQPERERTTVRTLLSGGHPMRCCCKRLVDLIRPAPK